MPEDWWTLLFLTDCGCMWPIIQRTRSLVHVGRCIKNDFKKCFTCNCAILKFLLKHTETNEIWCGLFNSITWVTALWIIYTCMLCIYIIYTKPSRREIVILFGRKLLYSFPEWFCFHMTAHSNVDVKTIPARFDVSLPNWPMWKMCHIIQTSVVQNVFMHMSYLICYLLNTLPEKSQNLN